MDGNKSALASSQRDSLLEARHMKIGASYFIVEVLKSSYSGRALKALYD